MIGSSKVSIPPPLKVMIGLMAVSSGPVRANL